MSGNRVGSLAGVVFLIALSSVAVRAQEGLADDLSLVVHSRSGSSRPSNASATKQRRDTREVVTAATGFIRLYQTFVSSQDGQVCSFSISCSRFARRAIERHGLVHGVAIASDRMQRCNGTGAAHYSRDSRTGLLIDLPLDRYRLGHRSRALD